ncbi:MAG: damage-inducible protein DinB [Candidatus Eisenbacteria bacterium]|nr:damage-inducible protein DinB [Candidatus Eisenbacteria bacterium]
MLRSTTVGGTPDRIWRWRMSRTVPYSELLQHMFWADALIWKGALESQRARDDAAVRDHLYHLHAVQHAFLRIWQGRSMDLPQPGAFEGLRALCLWGGEYHEAAGKFLVGLGDADYDKEVSVPWAEHVEKQLGQAPVEATLGETMLQVTFHTTYHRGQISALLRELGTLPPLTDFIAWVWLKKPKAQWPACGDKT